MAKELPFVFGVPAKGENFTDRQSETKCLVTNFTYGINTIIISPRRWGKTSLVRNAASKLYSKDIKVVYIDIFSCHNEWDFYNLYSTEIVRQTSSKVEEWLEYGKKFLSRLMPKFSFGSDPINDFSLSFSVSDNMEDRNDILRLPQKIAVDKGISIIVCIDEFQQISEFQNSITFQKRLRSVWQLFDNVSFCLFGSKRHMMNGLFDSQSKPFYKFGDIINLGRIPTRDWVEYIIDKFNKTGKTITEGQANRITELVERNSSYVQQLSWIVWTLTGDTVSDQDVEQAFQMILAQNGALFEKQIETLSGTQLNYLKAMSDGVQSGFSRKEIIALYGLGTSANVVNVQRVLQSKEFIYIEDGKSYFSDPLLPHWLKMKRI